MWSSFLNRKMALDAIPGVGFSGWTKGFREWWVQCRGVGMGDWEDGSRTGVWLHGNLLLPLPEQKQLESGRHISGDFLRQASKVVIEGSEGEGHCFFGIGPLPLQRHDER